MAMATKINNIFGLSSDVSCRFNLTQGDDNSNLATTLQAAMDDFMAELP